MSERLRVVIADDQPLVRTGLTTMIDLEDDMEVVAAVSDGEQAVDAARRLTPDVVCLDIRMPHMDGITAARQICGPEAASPIPVLILTTFDIDDYLFGAFEAGVSGFLLKDAEPSVVVDAVRSVAAGNGTIADSLTKRVLGELVSRRRTQPVTAARADELLTAREREIVLLLAEGLSNDEIARALVIETATVKSHLARILPKLGVKSRLQAAVWAYQNGLVTVGQ